MLELDQEYTKLTDRATELLQAIESEVNESEKVTKDQTFRIEREINYALISVTDTYERLREAVQESSTQLEWWKTIDRLESDRLTIVELLRQKKADRLPKSAKSKRTVCSISALNHLNPVLERQ